MSSDSAKMFNMLQWFKTAGSRYANIGGETYDILDVEPSFNGTPYECRVLLSGGESYYVIFRDLRYTPTDQGFAMFTESTPQIWNGRETYATFMLSYPVAHDQFVEEALDEVSSWTDDDGWNNDEW